MVTCGADFPPPHQKFFEPVNPPSNGFWGVRRDDFAVDYPQSALA